MVRLEEIVPGGRIRGIAPGDFVEILASRSFRCGPDAVDQTVL
jgi:hypothetical protein